MTRRYGKFEVSVALIKDNPEEVSKIFAGMVVTRAEQWFHKEAIEYFALSPHFREVAEGEEVPEYMAECTKHEDGSITVKWVEATMQPVGQFQTVVVNGTEIKTKMLIATYTDILQLTDLPFRADYTMTWSTKAEKGIMHHQGEPVLIKDGMIFNSTLTGDA